MRKFCLSSSPFFSFLASSSLVLPFSSSPLLGHHSYTALSLPLSPFTPDSTSLAAFSSFPKFASFLISFCGSFPLLSFLLVHPPHVPFLPLARLTTPIRLTMGLGIVKCYAPAAVCCSTLMATISALRRVMELCDDWLNGLRKLVNLKGMTDEM